MSKSDWIQVVSSVAIIVGIALVVWELQQSREISISERLTISTEVETNLRDLIVENADLWRKGCAGEELSDTEKVAYQQIVFAVYFKNFMRHHVSKTRLASAQEHTFVHFVARNAYHFPGFKRAWLAMPKKSYLWEPLIKEELERLERVKPEPLPIEACGLG